MVETQTPAGIWVSGQACLTDRTRIFYLRIKLSNSLGDANKSIATKKI
jgi:hypothetical protein